MESIERLYLIFKGNPARGTSQLNAAALLAKSGYHVTLVCAACPESTGNWLHHIGVEINVIGGYCNNTEPPIVRLWYLCTFWFRAWRWWQRMKPVEGKFAIGSLETAVALLPLLRFRPFIVMVHELYDRELRWKIFRKFVLRQARMVIVPNEVRAALLRYWCGLKKTPFIVGNRPPEDTITGELGVAAGRATQLMRQLRLENKRILLYQGAIDLRERDLLPVARACAARSDKWVFVLLGDDYESVAALRRNCPSLVYLGGLPAPQHLAVTALCDVGVVCYCWESLNTLFCAPNKTWEYAKFGKPMLANDVPTLKALMSQAHCGVSVDFANPTEILAALDQIDAMYSIYSAGADAYYGSSDENELARALKETVDMAFAEDQPLGCVPETGGLGLK